MELQPIKTSEAMGIFGMGSKDLARYPSYQECIQAQRDGKIPEEYSRFISTWFFGGLSKLSFTPAPGIDKDEAMRTLRALLSSWEPKHEHKELLAAWMAAEWFKDLQYERAERQSA